ncbi:MAG TPA: HAD-IC family P-type ATPase, partial [Spirochaetota bacterium]|nr:HAD-IC family P-type ATPase [Spirochaetota bacterium]
MKLVLEDFYNLDKDDALKKLDSSFKGIDDQKAEDNLRVYGLNEITQKKRKSLFHKIVDMMLEPMVLILMVAAGFSFFIKDIMEGFAILGVVIVNTIISLIQDGKAEKAVEELKKILSPQFKVLRNGSLEVIASKFIVPADVIVFEAGDILPADARVIEAKNLLVDEAHLTGESEPITKKEGKIDGNNLKLYEMKNIVFSGSKILQGYGKAMVIKTGSATEMGKIALNLEDVDDEKTPLQKKLDKEIKFLVGLAFFSAVFVLLVFILKNLGHLNINVAKEAILIAITIMVAVFPEGLPASITIALSLAVERLAKQSVIVKKLSSVETLGNVDYICTDKTGTITQHNMTVKEIFLGNKFFTTADIFKFIAEGKSHIIHDLFLISVKCSTATIEEHD